MDEDDAEVVVKETRRSLTNNSRSTRRGQANNNQVEILGLTIDICMN